jgi:hypothetical protein
MLNAPSNMCRQSQIPRLDCEDDGHLDAVVVMPVLTDAQHLHGPSPCAVKRSPYLIYVNEPPSWHLKNTKGERAIPESPHTKLHVRLLRLVTFSGCPLFCYVKLTEAFRDRLGRVEIPP